MFGHVFAEVCSRQVRSHPLAARTKGWSLLYDHIMIILWFDMICAFEEDNPFWNASTSSTALKAAVTRCHMPKLQASSGHRDQSDSWFGPSNMKDFWQLEWSLVQCPSARSIDHFGRLRTCRVCASGSFSSRLKDDAGVTYAARHKSQANFDVFKLSVYQFL